MISLKDRFATIGESMTINRLDNGYVFEANGRNHDREYASVKIVCTNVSEVYDLIEEANDMTLDK